MRMFSYIPLVGMVLANLCVAEESVTIEARLKAVKSETATDLQKAQDELIASLNRLIDAATQKGDLDRVEYLNRELVDFTEKKVLPTSVKPIQITRTVSVSLTRQKQVYMELITAYTKEGRFAEAKATRSQLNEISTVRQFIDLEKELQHEMLKNPGCEETSPANSYKGWTVVSGKWNPGVRDSVIDSTKAVEGSHFFFPGACFIGELKQEVPVDLFSRLIDEGALSCVASVYVHSWQQSPPDSCEFAIDFIDESGDVLETELSGKIASTKSWKEIGGKHAVPPKTRVISFRLIAHRTGPRGSTVCNAYFDSASLKFEIDKKIRRRR